MSTKKPQPKPQQAAFSQDRIDELNDQVEGRRLMITRMIQQVISGVKVAACVFGPGGHGKSWAVKQELDALTGKSWVHHTGTCTPRAFYDSLAANHSSLHVYEDMEPILKIPQYADILRPLLDDGTDQRVGHWDIKGEEASFTFKGGVVIICNEDLSKSKSPIGEALKSRVKPVRWELNMEEIMAVMKKMADAGYSRRGNVVTPAQCHEVADYLISLMSSGKAMHGVDLRFFSSHALPAMVDSNIRKTGDEWMLVVQSMLEGQVQELESRETRQDRLEKQALQVSMKKGNQAEKVAAWKELTGLAFAQYYVHLRNAKHNAKRNA